MKHLERFFNYIVESTESAEFDKDYLEELLVPMKDLGVSVNIDDYTGLIKPVIKGEFLGRGYITVSFRLDNFESVGSDEYFGGYRNMVSDEKVWEFLDELISFKNRLNSDKVLFYFNINQGGIFNPAFGISFLVPGELNSDIIELEKAYDIIRRKSNRGSTDFSYNTTLNLDRENKELIIRCSMAYTDRKFNNLISDIDKSLFNIEKVSEERDGWGGSSAVIKITLK